MATSVYLTGVRHPHPKGDKDLMRKCPGQYPRRPIFPRAGLKHAGGQGTPGGTRAAWKLGKNLFKTVIENGSLYSFFF